MRSCASRSSAAQLSVSICPRLPGISGLACAATPIPARRRKLRNRVPATLFFLRHPLALLVRLRKSDRNRLLAAFHFARFAARSAPCRSAFEAAHLPFDVLPHPRGIF